MEEPDGEDAGEEEIKGQTPKRTKANAVGPKGAERAFLREWLRKLSDSAVLEHKADLKDLIKLGELKSNKFDTDLLLKCVEVQHSQIQHLAVILIE